jgi:hypothetical protein
MPACTDAHVDAGTRRVTSAGSLEFSGWNLTPVSLSGSVLPDGDIEFISVDGA